MLNEDRLDEIGTSLKKSIDIAFSEAGDLRDVEALGVDEEDARVIADFIASLRGMVKSCVLTGHQAAFLSCSIPST
jgi:hypothetical protein